MEVKQVAALVNQATEEALGTEGILKEDLTNVVDVGTEIFNADATDKYVKALVNRISRVVFVDRVYSGSVPSVVMTNWEYGSVTQKIRIDLPEAEENESWQLEHNNSYDQDIFTKPNAHAKYFNSMVTFEVPISITEKQIKQSFINATELNSFVNMIFNQVDKSMTIKTDALVMRTINNLIGETAYDEYQGGDVTAKSGIRAVNLLKLYNDKFGLNVTAEEAVTDADFIRFASYTIGLYMSRMSKVSKLFNIGSTDKFTPADFMHVVFLDVFAKAADVYLQSDVYNNQFTKLPNGAEIVPAWQGNGTDYAFSNVSKINIKTASGHDVEISGVIGCIFDREALGVSHFDKRATNHYNGRAEFYNYWFKQDAHYFNDTDENFVFFFLA